MKQNHIKQKKNDWRFDVLDILVWYPDFNKSKTKFFLHNQLLTMQLSGEKSDNFMSHQYLTYTLTHPLTNRHKKHILAFRKPKILQIQPFLKFGPKKILCCQQNSKSTGNSLWSHFGIDNENRITEIQHVHSLVYIFQSIHVYKLWKVTKEHLLINRVINFICLQCFNFGSWLSYNWDEPTVYGW